EIRQPRQLRPVYRNLKVAAGYSPGPTRATAPPAVAFGFPAITRVQHGIFIPYIAAGRPSNFRSSQEAEAFRDIKGRRPECQTSASPDEVWVGPGGRRAPEARHSSRNGSFWNQFPALPVRCRT